MDDELKRNIKYLGLPGLVDDWPVYLQEAEKKRLNNDKFLQFIINKICEKKREHARVSRINRAKIPEKYVIEAFPFSRQPKLAKQKLLGIYESFSYMNEHQSIIWIGQTGVGKTGLATSFLMNTLERGYSGRFVLFNDLIEELYRAVADGSSKKVLKAYSAYDCLLIDEMGYVETDRGQLGLFFRLLQARHKRKTTLITTNLGFGEWCGFLKNEQMTAALIDRLTETSHVFNMKGCQSLRPKNLELD